MDTVASDLLVAFTVLGEAAPQGSKTRTKFGGIREANPRTRPWRQAVAAEALLTMGGRGPRDEAVELLIRYYFPRPLGHYGSGRNAVLREWHRCSRSNESEHRGRDHDQYDSDRVHQRGGVIRVRAPYRRPCVDRGDV